MLIFMLGLFAALALFMWRLRRGFSPDRFTPRKHWALALAQPMVDAVGPTGFFDPQVDTLTDEGRAFFRAPLLHQLEVRVDASDDDARAHLAGVFESSWFRADLHSPLPADDPQAALAFACVRMAHFVRLAMMMQWVDEAAGWRVLLLNAQRAQECFEGWEDFGRAYALGRRQWVGAFRADPLGKSLDEAALRALRAPPQGAWASLPWPGPPLFQG